MKWSNPFLPSRRSSYREPTHHGRLPLYILQFLQLLGSIVVLGIMIYFISHLRRSRIAIPWSFIVHLIVAVVSTTSVVTLLALYAGAARPPIRTLVLNSLLLALWGLSLGLIVRFAKATVTSQCSSATWNNSTGMMVCQLYKALFAFIIIALASTILAISYITYARTTTHSSKYVKTSNPAFPSSTINLNDEDSEYRNLAPPTSSEPPTSAPAYQSSFRSPLSPDDRPLGFPASPSPRLSGYGGMEAKLGTGVFQPPQRSPGYLALGGGGGEDMGVRMDKGKDLEREETEFSFLAPGATYDRGERDLSA